MTQIHDAKAASTQERDRLVELCTASAATHLLAELIVAKAAPVYEVVHSIVHRALDSNSTGDNTDLRGAGSAQAPDAIAAVLQVAPHCEPEQWYSLFLLGKLVGKRCDGRTHQQLDLLHEAVRLADQVRQKRNKEGSCVLATLHRLHATRGKLACGPVDGTCCFETYTRVWSPLTTVVCLS